MFILLKLQRRDTFTRVIYVTGSQCGFVTVSVIIDLNSTIFYPAAAYAIKSHIIIRNYMLKLLGNNFK